MVGEVTSDSAGGAGGCLCRGVVHCEGEVVAAHDGVDMARGTAGLMIGSARSMTIGKMQGRRQNAIAGVRREMVDRRAGYETAIFRLQCAEKVYEINRIRHKLQRKYQHI